MLTVQGDACERGKRSKECLTVLLNRSIVLFVDYCPAHPHIYNLTNIELMILPPNTTSGLQYLYQSIIKTLKVNFSHKRTASIVMDLDLGLGYSKWDVL
ncbi:hypothetical protein PR048_025607 [Dryococelus australis]|uniref:DDE-1 domain-containing protein n=1 Tax=Dryococelus australis TaxID=614101 RepID=A0ABQ9GRR7_9NEOP|nr:hypothetical protein PR048_025607 [Dryococelus australis]